MARPYPVPVRPDPLGVAVGDATVVGAVAVGLVVSVAVGVGIGDPVAVWGWVTVTVGAGVLWVEEVGVEVGGSGLIGLALRRGAVPNTVVPEEWPPVTVLAIGCPDSNSAPVTMPMAITNKAAAETANCFGLTNDHHRALAGAAAAGYATAVAAAAGCATAVAGFDSAWGSAGGSDTPNRLLTAASTVTRIRFRVRTSEWA